MKRVLTLITTIVLAMTAFADNRIYIEDSGYDVGTDIVLPVYMTNTDSITAFQFDLFLPEDLTLGEEGITLDTERTTVTAHNFTFHKVDYGWYRVICYSTGLNLFKGSEGAIAHIHIATPEATGSYEISISDIEMTKPDLTKITCDDVTAHIKVGSGSSADNEDALKRFMEKYEESVGVYNDVKAETVDKLLDEEGNVINKKYEDLVTEFITELDNYKKELDGMKSDAEDEYATGELSDNIEMYIATLTYSDKSIQEAQKAFLMAMENLNKIIAMGECGTCTWVLMSGGQLIIGPSDEEGVEDGVLADWTAVSTTFNGVAPWLAYADSIRSVMFMPGVSALTCERMFSNCVNLEKVQFNDFDTKSVTSMYSMFGDCTNLVEADFSKFNTEHVTDMSNMFVRCSNIKSLDLKSFNTSNVTAMSTMFHGCSKLSNVDLTSFNTESVTDFAGMFASCKSLKELNLSSFNTKNGTYMFSMFEACDSLETLNISNLNTLNANNISGMFTYCDRLTTIVSDNATPSSLKVGTFDSFENRANCTLVVPEGTKDLYAATDGWNELGKIDDGTSDGPVIPADAIASGETGTCIWYITSEGELVIAPRGRAESGDLPEEGTYWSDIYPWHEYKDTIKTARIDALVNATTCSNIFYELYNLQTINLSGLNTSNVTNMNGMFAGCSALKSINLNNLNTENVENMASMFDGCNHLTSLDVSSFNTKNVTDMSGMFAGCSSLTNIELSNFNTQNVTSMRNMFYGCSSLLSLDLSSFDTQKVENMRCIFMECFALKSINFGNFNVKNVGDMAAMFNVCKSLESIDVSNFDTRNATDMSHMFKDCYSLNSVDVSHFNTQNVTSMAHMFQNSAIDSLDLGNFNTEKVTSMRAMFAGCGNIKSLDLSSFNTENVEDMNTMFADCPNLTTLNLTNFTTVNNKDFYIFPVTGNLTTIICNNATPPVLLPGTFETLDSRANCTLVVPEGTKVLYAAADGWNELGKIDDGTYDFPADAIAQGEVGTCVWYITSEGELVIAPADGVSGDLPEYGAWTAVPWDNYRNDVKTARVESGVNATSCAYLFSSLGNMVSIDLGGLNTTNVTDMREMFNSCYSLTSLDLSKFNTQNVTNMYSMISGCWELTSIDLSSFDTRNVKEMNFMFSDCRSLSHLDVTNFNTENVTTMANMFGGCEMLEDLDVTNFNTSNVTDMTGMFSGCKMLKNLDVTNFNTSNVTDMYGMFKGCSALTSLDVNSFNTMNVKNMRYMFGECSNLESLDLSSFNTENVNYMEAMFGMCTNLKTLNLTNFNTTIAYDLLSVGMLLTGCDSLKTIISNNEIPSQLLVGTFNSFVNRDSCTLIVPSGTKALYAAADGWNELGKIDDGSIPLIPADAIASGKTGTCIWYITSEGELVIAPADGVSGDLPEEGWNSIWNHELFKWVSSTPWSPYSENIIAVKVLSGVNATSCANLFCGLDKMIIADLSGLNTENVEDMSGMFHGCSSLASLDLSNLSSDTVTNICQMFLGCSSLTSLDLSNFNTPNLKYMGQTFQGCSSLTSLDLRSLNTQNVTHMYGIFSGCSSLTSLDLSNFNTQSVTNMLDMFSGCSSLTSLDLSSFNTQNAPGMSQMFKDCSSLTSLDLSNLNTQNVTEMTSMFMGCSSLTSLNFTNFNMSNVEDGKYGFMFYGCGVLEVIISDNLTPSILKEGTFKSLPTKDTCQLIVPTGTKALYAAADGWNELGNIKENIPENVLAQGTCGTCTWTLNKDGELVIAPNSENGGELDNWVAKGEKAPWDEYSDEVRKVTIEDGVGGIEDGMLGDLNNLEYVNWNTGKDNIPQGIFGTEENNVIIYAPQGVDSDRDHNVVINGVAEKIILKDGYPLEIPEAFEANYIYYVRDFSKATKTGHNYGWESIVLPYDVQHFVHETKGNLAPFGSEGTTKRPFWLSRFTHDGDFAFANEMKANVPYIIAMPNDSVYDNRYILAGKVAFISYNTTVYPTDEAESVESERATMHGSYVFNESPDYYVINDDIFDGYMPGAVFGSGLTVKPFSAYLDVYDKQWEANRRVFIINVNENEDVVDGIFDVSGNDNDKVVYDLNGIRINPSQMKRGRVYLKLKNSNIEKFKY